MESPNTNKIETKSIIDSDELASMIAHQLREPVTSIRWFTEMLIKEMAGKLLPEQKNLLEFLHESSGRLVYVLDLLLRLSRVESGRLMIHPIEASLSDVVREVTKSLAEAAAAKSVGLTITEDAELPTVFIDKTVLFEVVQNLVSNAIRYSPQGSSVSIHVSRAEHDFAISVSDRGIGIPEGEQEHIFQKFFRASNARHAVPGGSGLGLALVKALVDEFGGAISFVSKPSQGTTFMARIPAAGMKARVGSVTLSEPSAVGAAFGSEARKQKTVFVVEDDEFLSRAYRYIFEKSGYEVWLAKGLMDALPRLEGGPPDVVLLDLMLPDGSGYSFMSGMREKQAWQNVPVVILTNLGTQEDIDKGTQLGAADYLVKANMDVEGILKRVEKVLEK